MMLLSAEMDTKEKDNFCTSIKMWAILQFDPQNDRGCSELDVYPAAWISPAAFIVKPDGKSLR